MQPQNLRFGGGVSETILHPLVLVAMLLAILLIWFLPRKYIIVPVLSMFFLVPLGQQVLIGGLHFFTSRIIILVVAMRMLVTVFSSAEGVFGGRMDILDKVFILWALFRALAGILTFMQSGALIYQMGFLLDAIGGYFILRHLIHDDEDILRTIRVLAVIAFLLAGSMLYEKLTVANLFASLGGVRTTPEVREGLVRATGPFQHEILAGVFGATVLPMFFLLWKSGQSRILAMVGALGATVMTATSASSTPILAYAAAILAISFWPLRRRMRLVRWGIVGAVVALHLVMKAPVWFVIQHLNILGGSSGYHRAMLVNDFILHFGDWWLIGTKENHTWGFNMWDLCNQFVAEGEVGGLATFACFLALIVICFSKLGRARKAVEGDQSKEWYFWLMGSALFAHMIAYCGVSYFDQTRFLWFVLLATIVTATAPYLVRVPAPRPAPVAPRALLPSYAPPARSRFARPSPMSSPGLATRTLRRTARPQNIFSR